MYELLARQAQGSEFKFGLVVLPCKPSPGEAGTSSLLELTGQSAGSDQKVWGLSERLGLSG